MSGSQFRYPQCAKGECHVGQILNLVCVEPQCIQKSIICGICYDEEHRNHKIKPLKVIINNSRKYLEHLTPMTFDVEKVKTSINETRTKLLNTFDDFEKHVKESMGKIRNSISAIFIKVVEQIELKTGKNQLLIAALDDIKNREMKYEEFVTLMQKLLAGVPVNLDEEEEMEMSGLEIQQAVERLQAKIQKDLKVKEGKIKEQIQSFMNILQKSADNPCIFQTKIDFKFSSQHKHTGITLVNETTIKSSEGYNYHFGLMQPSIQQKGNRSCKVAFKIKQNVSNWLAVGLCYKSTIVASNYTFNYSSLGHGAYLISSNGGSWSSIDSAKNNTVNAFSYAKDDIVVVQYEPNESRVTFRKKGTDQTHMIQFQVKEDDELYLCGLFYYNNDEIEYIGYDQQ